jgi:hypothetical protein
MARSSKSHKALTGACLAFLPGLLVATCNVSPAASIGLPTLPVEVPTVTVKTPTVTVKTPTVTVKTPTVTVKTPSLPVTTPSVPVKTPTATRPSAPVPAPTVSAKTPDPAKTNPSKAPSVKVDAPSVSGEGPTVLPRAPSASSLSKVAAPVGGVTTTTPTTPSAPAVKPAGRRATPSPPAATPNSASSAGPSAQASPPEGTSGYGAGPRLEPSIGETGTRRTSVGKARMAEDGSLAETVSRLSGCLSELPRRSRRALMLRAGVGSPQALGRRATAARLHLGVERFARVERRALGELRDAARTGACGQMSEVAEAVVAFVGPSASQRGFGATGGVEAVRYTFSPPSRHDIKPAVPSSGSLLGAISPTASDAIVVLLLVVGAAIAAGILVTRGSGHSLPWRRWRRRVVDGLRWPR